VDEEGDLDAASKASAQAALWISGTKWFGVFARYLLSEKCNYTSSRNL